jgi:hypothetical protein
MKYNVEGDIDFFAELYSLIDKEDKEDNEKICLITNKPLTDKFIQMNCGHTFNYIPLYHDILNHKKKFNSMESRQSHLKIDEIRCPYCRNRQNGVLPYYEEFDLEKVNGVNIITEIKSKNTSSDYYKKCDYMEENPKFNPELIETENFLNNKYIKCYSYYGTKISGINNYGDEKCYCYFHKKMVINKYKKELKEKEKKEKTEAKEKAKKEKMELKEKEKIELKEKKQQLKLSKLNDKIDKISEINASIDEENVLLSVNNGCTQLLKYGPNKGNPCCKKIFENGLCKRHLQNV